MRKSKKSLVMLFLLTLMATVNSFAGEVEFEEDHRLPLVYINVAIKAGAVTDPQELSGISNFVSEMLLRGTATKSKEELDLELDQIGAVLGIETRAESIILRGSVLSSNLKPFLALLTEIVTTPSFPDAEIEKLKAETISQILEERGSDGALASRKFSQFFFGKHPYGNPTTGTISGIKKITKAAIQKHYDLLFRDELFLIVGSGDSKKEVIEDFSRTLGDARPGGELMPTVTTPKNWEKRRVQIVDKPDRSQTQVIGGQVGVRMTDENYFPLYLANQAFGGGSFSSRMMKEIRVQRGWSYGAYSYFWQGLQPRLWAFQFYPAQKDTAASVAYIIDMLNKLKTNGISAEEFEFSKTSLINSAGFMYNTPEKRVENKLLEKTLKLPDGFIKTYATQIRKLTLNEVNKAISNFIRPEQIAITIVGTAKNLRNDIAKAIGVSSEEIVITPYNKD